MTSGKAAIIQPKGTMILTNDATLSSVKMSELGNVNANRTPAIKGVIDNAWTRVGLCGGRINRMIVTEKMTSNKIIRASQPIVVIIINPFNNLVKRKFNTIV